MMISLLLAERFELSALDPECPGCGIPGRLDANEAQ
jgi:hypothetical protein